MKTFSPKQLQCSFFPIFPISFRKNPGALKRRLDADCITSCASVSGGFFGSWTTNGENEFLPGFCRVFTGFYQGFTWFLPGFIGVLHGNFEEA